MSDRYQAIKLDRMPSIADGIHIATQLANVEFVTRTTSGYWVAAFDADLPDSPWLRSLVATARLITGSTVSELIPASLIHSWPQVALQHENGALTMADLDSSDPVQVAEWVRNTRAAVAINRAMNAYGKDNGCVVRIAPVARNEGALTR